MWEQVKTSYNSIILSLNYNDFALIEVEKKTNSKGHSFYETRFHIDEVTDQSLDVYKLDDLSRILETAKTMIEDLFDEIDEMSQENIYEWLDNFVEALNDY